MFFFIADKTCGLGNWDEDVVEKETEDKCLERGGQGRVGAAVEGS